MKRHNYSLLKCLFYSILLNSFLFVGKANAQTRPTSQGLIFSYNFANLAHNSSTYPTGFQGWKIANSSGTSFKTVAPIANTSLIANGSASSTAGGVYNYNGKIGMLASTSIDPAIVFCANTMGFTYVTVTFDIMTIRNPYDGTNNTRFNNVELQYRADTANGTFTSLSGSIYRNNTVTQTGSGVTTPQNLQTITVTLPASCENLETVQIRIVQRDSTGSGARPSFAIDNICITGTSTISASGSTTFCSGESVNLTAINGDSWLWSNGDTTQSITVSASGSYNVTVTEGASCNSSATAVNVTVNSFNYQAVLFNESVGTVSQTTSIADHESNNGFDNDNLTMSGTADVRYTTPSSGYTGASGGANVFFALTHPTNFKISGINTSYYENVNLEFGLYKSRTASDGTEFIVEVSTNDTNYTQVEFDPLPTGTGTAVWHYVQINDYLPVSENLFIRFSSSDTSTYFRLDDIKLIGDIENSYILANGLENYCTGDTITLTASEGVDYLWSTSDTVQVINITESGNYYVTITDNNGCEGVANLNITLPDSLAITDTIVNVTCFGQSNGSIDLTITGGTSPYTYLWSNDSTTQDLNNIPVGNYSVTVTDSHGCTIVDSFSISLISQLAANAGYDKYIFSGQSVQIGSAPINGLSYSWSPSTGLSNPIIANPVSNTTITTSYILEVSDSLCERIDSVIVNVLALCIDTVDTIDYSPFQQINFLPRIYEPDKIYLKISNNSNVDLINYPDIPLDTTNILYSIFTNYGVVNVEKPFVGFNTPKWDRSYRITFTDTSNINCFISNLQSVYCVEYAEKVPIMYTNIIPNDSLLGEQYYMSLINADEASNIFQTNPLAAGNTIVAIVDDAVLTTHEDLATNIFANNWDEANNDNNPNPPFTGVAAVNPNRFSHGTHVAGIAGGVTNNTHGIASVGWSNNIMCVKTSPDNNTTNSVPSAFDGVEWAANNGAQVINMSWGGFAPSQMQYNILRDARDLHDIVLVASSGNNASMSPNYPAAYGEGTVDSAWEDYDRSLVIAVAALDQNNNVSDWGPGGFGQPTGSNVGFWVDISAYGTGIISSNAGSTGGNAINNLYGARNGTSMAAPQVSGVAGLMRSYRPTATAGDIYNCLVFSANTDIYNPIAHTTNIEGTLGWGRLDAEAALRCISPECDSTIAVIIPSSTTLCSDSSITLTVNQGISYLWSTNDTTQTINISNAGTYWVIVSFGNGCSDSTSIIINPTSQEAQIIFTENSGNFANDGILCGTDIVNVSAYWGNSYHWSFANFTIPSFPLFTSVASLPFNYGICVTVTDVGGCNNVNDVVCDTIHWLLPPTADAGEDVTICRGENTALNATGGVEYLWSPTTGLSNPNISNPIASPLTTTTYTVSVTDANGCTDIDQIIVTVNQLPNVTISPANPSICIGESINLNANGAVAYVWSTTENTNLINVNPLTTTVYTVTGTDANGCSSTGNVTVTVNALPTANAGSDITVCQIENVTITENGVGNISWTWSANPTDATLSGQEELHQIIVMPSQTTTYTVTVTNAQNCTSTDNVVVTIPSPLSVTITPTFISGTCQSTANAFAGGGTPNYTYLWSNTQTSSMATGLCANTDYYVTVTDANGCTAIDTININNAISCSIITTPSSCGDSSGTASAVVVGGTFPYTYLWSNNETTIDIDSLTYGTYFLTVIDNINDTATCNALVDNVSTFSVSVATTNQLCYGYNNGTAIVSVSGGCVNCTYLWSNAQTNDTITGLAPGQYLVTITDTNGTTETTDDCIDIKQAIIGTSFTASISPNQVTCHNDCDGSVTAIKPAAFTNVSYLWNFNNATTQSLNNICAGTYAVTITNNDTTNCTASYSATLTNPDSLILDLTHRYCFQTKPSRAIASVSGGATPYSFVWTNGSTNDTLNLNESLLETWGYTIGVTVTDHNGCSVADSFTIVPAYEGDLITIESIQNTSPAYCGNCNGHGGALVYTVENVNPLLFVWDDTIHTDTLNYYHEFCEGYHTLTIYDVNNCSVTDDFYVAASDPQPRSITITASNPDYCMCNGNIEITGYTNMISPYQYNWTDGGNYNDTNDIISWLCSGDYIVTVTDRRGCDVIDSVSIGYTDSLETSITINDSASCNGYCDGNATVNVTGVHTPFTYLWDNGETTATADSLCAGAHSVTVTDSNSCSVIEYFSIGEPAPITFSLTSVDPICGYSNGRAEAVNIQGGTGSYSFNWTGNRTTNPITALAANTYYITVNDSLGCTATSSVTLVCEEFSLNNGIPSSNPKKPTQCVYSLFDFFNDIQNKIHHNCWAANPTHYTYFWQEKSLNSLSTDGVKYEGFEWWCNSTSAPCWGNGATLRVSVDWHSNNFHFIWNYDADYSDYHYYGMCSPAEAGQGWSDNTIVPWQCRNDVYIMNFTRLDNDNVFPITGNETFTNPRVVSCGNGYDAATYGNDLHSGSMLVTIDGVDCKIHDNYHNGYILWKEDTTCFDCVTLSYSGSYPFASYAWYKTGNSTPLSTSATYEPDADGDYYLVATDVYSNAITSDTISVQLCNSAKSMTLGKETINQNTGFEFNIMPNPNKGEFMIGFNKEGAVEIQIYDMVGSLISVTNNAFNRQVINMEDKPKGIYIIRANYGNEYSIKKVIIN